MKKRLPKELLVYVFDYDNGKPIYNVAENVDEIPDDCDGNLVGNYVLNGTHILKVKRELK